MALKNNLLGCALLALGGMVVGSGLTAWYWSIGLRHASQDSLQVSIQRNLALRSELESSSNEQAKRRIESFLTTDLQALNTIGSSKGPGAPEALLLQKEVASWRARHSSFALNPQFAAEVDRAIANVR